MVEDLVGCTTFGMFQSGEGWVEFITWWGIHLFIIWVSILSHRNKWFQTFLFKFIAISGRFLIGLISFRDETRANHRWTRFYDVQCFEICMPMVSPCHSCDWKVFLSRCDKTYNFSTEATLKNLTKSSHISSLCSWFFADFHVAGIFKRTQPPILSQAGRSCAGTAWASEGRKFMDADSGKLIVISFFILRIDMSTDIPHISEVNVSERKCGERLRTPLKTRLSLRHVSKSSWAQRSKTSFLLEFTIGGMFKRFLSWKLFHCWVHKGMKSCPKCFKQTNYINK